MNIKIDGDMWLSPHFQVKEFIATSGYEPHLLTGELKLDYRLPLALEDLMRELGINVLGISSGYRTLAQENDLGKRGYYAVGKSSQRVQGKAVDCPIRWFKGCNEQEVVNAAKRSGFKGIGIYSWGYHFDVREQNHVSMWRG